MKSIAYIHIVYGSQVVSSRHWPLISRYRASVRTQSPKVEMIDSLFKKISDTEDDGIMKWDFSLVFDLICFLFKNL